MVGTRPYPAGYRTPPGYTTDRHAELARGHGDRCAVAHLSRPGHASDNGSQRVLRSANVDVRSEGAEGIGTALFSLAQTEPKERTGLGRPGSDAAWSTERTRAIALEAADGRRRRR